MKLVINSYLIVSEKSEGNKPLAEGKLSITQTTWFFLKKSLEKHWVLTDNTFEVYKKKNDKTPEYFIWFDWSEVKVNYESAGALIEITNNNLELLLRAETPRSADDWREKI